MANQTAGDVLRFIGEGQKTSPEIAEALSLPMNTAKYHIENLLEAGLISVSSTKYSVKGREVKVYSLTNQLLIVAPRQSNVRSLLLKYASLFGIVAFGSLVIAVLSPLLRATSGASGTSGAMGAVPLATVQEAGGAIPEAAADAVRAFNSTGNAEMAAAASKGFGDATAAQTLAPAMAANTTAAPAPDTLMSVAQATAVHVPQPAGTLPFDTALAFLLGGSLVILVLLCYEVHVWKKMNRQ